MSKSTTKKKTWGGARQGAGPKFKDPSEVKKQVTLYVVSKELDRMGGIEAFKDKCYALLK